MNDVRTFHELLNVIVSAQSCEKALNVKRAGEWEAVSTQLVYDQVRNLALGLDDLGVKQGQTVAVMGHPSAYWMIVDYAIMSIGAVTVPIFPEEPRETRAHKLADAQVDYVFLLDQQSYDELKPDLMKVKVAISLEVDAEGTIALSEVMERGRVADSKDPSRYGELGARIQPTDLSTIYYTSGSSGAPKGVELSHYNIISQIKAASERIPLKNSDVALSCLPLAHSFERFMLHYYMASGVPVYFNSDIHELGRDLQYVKPSITAMVPRILSKFYDKFSEKINSSPMPKRQIGRFAIDWAFRNEPSSGINSLKGITVDTLVFRKLRRALGGNMRVVITGGAAMPPDLYRFFVNAGVPVFQGYGMTEASPVLSVNSPSDHKIGTVGLPFPGVEISISEQGEVLAQGPNVMSCYHNLPAETASTVDSEGWLHTGDLGDIDEEGYLSITGRIKELLKTSCGEYVAPVAIEHSLCSSPLIDMVLVVGEGRPYVSCILFVASDLSKEELTEVDKHVSSVNEKLEHWEQIRSYRIVSDALTPESGELTPTLKIRRHVICEKYKTLIEEMYGNASEHLPNAVRRAS